MRNLINHIEEYKKGNSEEILEIIKIFSPILNSFSYKLRYEDAFNDLQLHLILTVFKLDLNKLNNKTEGAIVNYVAKSIYYEYIRLSRDQCRKKEMEIYEKDDENRIENVFGKEDDYSIIFFESLKGFLTEKEFDVIKMIYYNDLPIKYIATKIGKSKWNVYKLRDSAFAKIRKNINNEKR